MHRNPGVMNGKIGVRSVYNLESSGLIPMQRSTSLGSSLQSSKGTENNVSNRIGPAVLFKEEDKFCGESDRNFLKNSITRDGNEKINKQYFSPQNYQVNKSRTTISPVYTSLRPADLCLNDEDNFNNRSVNSSSGKNQRRPMSIIEEEEKTNDYLHDVNQLKTESPITIGRGAFSPYSPIVTDSNVVNFMSRQAPDGCDSCVSNDVDPKKETSEDLLSFDSLKVEASSENIYEKLVSDEKEFSANSISNDVNDFYRITFEGPESKKSESPKDLVFRKDTLNTLDHSSPVVGHNTNFSCQFNNQVVQVSKNYKRSPCYTSYGAYYNSPNKNRYSKSIDNIFSESYLNQFDNRIKQEMNTKWSLYPETPNNRDEMLVASASTSEEDMILQKMPELECSYTLPRKKASPKHAIPRTMSKFFFK